MDCWWPLNRLQFCTYILVEPNAKLWLCKKDLGACCSGKIWIKVCLVKCEELCIMFEYFRLTVVHINLSCYMDYENSKVFFSLNPVKVSSHWYSILFSPFLFLAGPDRNFIYSKGAVTFIRFNCFFFFMYTWFKGNDPETFLSLTRYTGLLHLQFCLAQGLI